MRRIGYLAAVALSVGGFALAIAGNVLVPQVAAVEITSVRVGDWLVNFNGLYRMVLGAVVLGYLLDALISRGNEKNRCAFVHGASLRFAVGIALLAWDILGTKTQVFVQPFFPGPAQIVGAFLEEGDFILQNTLYSLRLYLWGYLLGAAFGVGTGILIGWFPRAYYWISPVLRFSGIIPAVAWMPFAMTLLPTPFAAAVFLIVICVWFPVASVTAQGVQSTPKVLFEAARTLGGDTRYLLFHVAVPNALPQVFQGLSTANAFAFTTLVMAEMMGQPGGLGYYINMAKIWSAYYKVFAAILVMAILFSAITKVLNIIEARALRWQEGLLSKQGEVA